MRRQRRRRRAGFTLVEIMAVVAIIALLASIVAINVVGRISKSRKERIRADMSNIEKALKMYQMEEGRYPETLEDLLGGEEEGDSYLESMPLDPWNRKYMYERTPEMKPPYTITCLGADGSEGGEGDDRDYTNHELLHHAGEEGGGVQP